jgi:hypothetical protein
MAAEATPISTACASVVLCLDAFRRGTATGPLRSLADALWSAPTTYFLPSLHSLASKQLAWGSVPALPDQPLAAWLAHSVGAWVETRSWPRPTADPSGSIHDLGTARKELHDRFEAVSAAVASCVSCTRGDEAVIALTEAFGQGQNSEMLSDPPSGVVPLSTAQAMWLLGVWRATHSTTAPDEALMSTRADCLAEGLSDGKAKHRAKVAAASLGEFWGDWRSLLDASDGAACDPESPFEFPERYEAAGMELLESVGGVQGVALLLGQRETVGSHWAIPPPFHSLLSSAMESHAKGDLLTVAARAAAKHAHRGAEGWFGDSATGTADERNVRALTIVSKMLREAVWWNVHSGAFESTAESESVRVVIMEVRVAEGYGARWKLGPLEFRGFLEPHSDDGHANRWRH